MLSKITKIYVYYEYKKIFVEVTSVGFWEDFYDGVREAFFSDRVYVLREIVRKPKTIREISEKTKIPYVTVRKYLTWAKSKGLATVVGTKKEKS